MLRNKIYFSTLIFFVVFFFIIDLRVGSANISFRDFWNFVVGTASNESINQIILSIRLPRVVTALIAGAGISLCGLLMQTLFRNPLADTSILGISGGSGLGVGVFIMISAMSPSIFTAYSIEPYFGMIISSILGAVLILLLISMVMMWLNDIVSVLLIGVMLGFFTGSIISILQYFSNPETVKSFLMWTFGNLNNTTWEQLYYILPICILGIICVSFMPKSLNLLLLGEGYAQGLGLNIKKTRIIIISLTALIVGTLTAFIGPIVFVGIAVPHFARMLFKTSNHQILIPATILCGMIILLLCDIITHLPAGGTTLPINAVTSIIGAPVVISILLKRRRQKSIFN